VNKATLIVILSAATLVLAACGGGGGSSGGGSFNPIGGGGGNSAPVFTSSPPTGAVEGVLYSYQATATDANGDFLSWSLTTSPTGMTVGVGGSVQWTPTPTQVGSHPVTLSVNDGTVSTNQSWTIIVSAAGGGGNSPPVITSTPVTTATVGVAYSYQVTATDADGDTLAYTLNTAPSGMTINGSSGLIAWTPTAGQVGANSVSVDVSDGQVSATQNFTVTVSSAGGGGSSTATGGTGGGTGTVNGTYQSRGYRLHVPASYSASTPSPLVIALHGYGDTHTNFHSTLAASGWTTAANNNNFILMTPQSLNASRPSFLHLTSGGGFSATPTQNELAGVILAAYYGVGATHNIETTQIYLIGFSEGGVCADVGAYWFCKEIKAAAPYAGAITGKPFPIDRNIPMYVICGTTDSGYSGSQTTYSEWTTAGHSTNNAWVSGVGHSFSALCTTGPSPSSVYTWMAGATATAVTSAYNGTGGGAGTSDPSGGSGGAYPGNQSRTVTVSGLGSHTYYLYIPSSYVPGTPMPVLFAFHGSGGAGTAPAAAQQVRNDWATVANTGNFIVVAQAATGSGGGWLPNNDVAILNEIINDMLAAYNIEQKRVYGWGYSAGGHLMHAIGLNSSTFFAAYGVSAGNLQSLAGTGAPAAASRKLGVAIHIGTSDPMLAAVQSDRNNFLANGWTQGTNLYYTEFTGGHTYSTAHLSSIWNSISSHTLP
jgi:poly(3-hydroxybutyrate) depolymerase